MKRSTLLIILAVLAIGGTGAVYAYGKHGHWHMTPAEKVALVTDRVSEKLELNPQQRQNFVSLAETVAQLMVEARSSKAQHLAEIDQLLEGPSFNQARALELVQHKTDTINNKAPLVVSQLAIFLDSLSAGQKQQLRGYIEHHHEHHRRGHDGH